MKKVLQEVKTHLEQQFKINNYGKVVLVDGADEHLRDMVINAHCIADQGSPILPSDFIYETLYRLLIEYDNANTIDDLYDLSVEPEIYNHDLLKWVSSNLVRSSYVDEAIIQQGQSNVEPEFFSTLRYAQALEIEDIKHVLANYLEDEIERRLENEDEVEV